MIKTMIDVDKIYKEILLENDVKENELSSSYKKRLKKLLQENLRNLGRSLKAHNDINLVQPCSWREKQRMKRLHHSTLLLSMKMT